MGKDRAEFGPQGRERKSKKFFLTSGGKCATL